MRRQRLSWNRKANTSSRRMRRRTRRANSELPMGEPASPAYRGQPPFAEYEKGNTSEWAEDVHPGPYGNGEHPATPDEGPASPAYKAAALERKAAKCIRIAQAQLGKRASVAAVEELAVRYMDLSNRQIMAKLRRAEEVVEEMEEEMEEGTSHEESKKKARLMRRLSFLERKLMRLAEDEAEKEDHEEGAIEDDEDHIEDLEEDEKEDKEDLKKDESKKKARLMKRLSFLERKLMRLAKEEEMEEMEEETEKEESKKKARLMKRLSFLERKLKKLAKEEMEEEQEDEEMEEAKKKAFLRRRRAMKNRRAKSRRRSSWEMMEDEEMEELLEMMEEESMAPEFAEEAMMDKMSEMEELLEMMEEGTSHEMMEDSMDAGIALVEEGMEDPMGVMDEAVSDQEMMILSKLFGKSAEDAEKKKEDEEKAEAEAAETIQEEVEEKAKEKKARLRPQPKRASKGATRLGGITKEASSEISDLSKLWTSAPDVSKFF